MVVTTMLKVSVVAFLLLVSWAESPAAQSMSEGRRLDLLELPDGFRVELFAEVPGAREIETLDDGRTILVSSRRSGVFRVRDEDLDGRAERVEVMFSSLKVPHGLAINPQDGALFIVEQHRVIRVADPLAADMSRERVSVVWRGLPDESWHGSRAADFGPDGWLYVAVGVPCNICEPRGIEDAIIRLTPDGSQVEVYAEGVRNSVGFDWHPTTNEFFFTDNGGDNLGDLIPPDELNHAPRPGLHFGFPYVWGSEESRYPGQGQKPSDTVPASIDFEAHAAALGIRFYDGQMFPSEYRGDAFIAQHGSWNRDPNDPAGYRIMRVRFDEAGLPVGKEVFIDGFLDAEKNYWGRPAQLAIHPDGSLLISDDASGAIYRVIYEGK